MATLEDLDDMERDEKEEKQNDDKDGDKKEDTNGDADMKDVADKKDAKKEDEDDDDIDMEVLSSSTRDIINRKRLLDNDTRIMKSEFQRLNHEKTAMNEKIKDNMDKIENNR